MRTDCKHSRITSKRKLCLRVERLLPINALAWSDMANLLVSSESRSRSALRVKYRMAGAKLVGQRASLIPVRVDRQGFAALGTTKEEVNNGLVYLFSNAAKYVAQSSG